MIELHLPPQDLAALTALAHHANTRYSDQVRALVLFGSKARGDFSSASDTDVLALCDQDDPNIKRRLWHLAFDLLLECGAYLSVRVMSLAHWQELAARQPQLYTNLVRDGIVIYTRPGTSLTEFASRPSAPAMAAG